MFKVLLIFLSSFLFYSMYLSCSHKFYFPFIFFCICNKYFCVQPSHIRSIFCSWKKAITFKMLTSTIVASIMYWGGVYHFFFTVQLGVEKHVQSFLLDGQRLCTCEMSLSSFPCGWHSSAIFWRLNLEYISNSASILNLISTSLLEVKPCMNIRHLNKSEINSFNFNFLHSQFTTPSWQNLHHQTLLS